MTSERNEWRYVEGLIMQYLNTKKRSVSFTDLYALYPNQPKQSFRSTMYRLIGQGKVRRVNKGRLVRFEVEK